MARCVGTHYDVVTTTTTLILTMALMIPTLMIPTTTPSKDAAGSEPPSPRIDETKDDSFVMEDRIVSDIIRRSVAALALEPRIGSFQAVRVGARDANKYICKLYSIHAHRHPLNMH